MHGFTPHPGTVTTRITNYSTLLLGLSMGYPLHFPLLVSTGHISLLELYIDFSLFAKSLCPVPFGGNKGIKAQKHLLKDLDQLAMTIPQSLAQQNVIWVGFLGWACANGFIFWPYPIIKQSNCLTDLGYSLSAPAPLSTHPNLTMGNKAYTVLISLFRTPSGKRRNLNIAYNGEST